MGYFLPCTLGEGMMSFCGKKHFEEFLYIVMVQIVSLFLTVI